MASLIVFLLFFGPTMVTFGQESFNTLPRPESCPSCPSCTVCPIDLKPQLDDSLKSLESKELEVEGHRTTIKRLEDELASLQTSSDEALRSLKVTYSEAETKIEGLSAEIKKQQSEAEAFHFDAQTLCQSEAAQASANHQSELSSAQASSSSALTEATGQCETAFSQHLQESKASQEAALGEAKAQCETASSQQLAEAKAEAETASALQLAEAQAVASTATTQAQASHEAAITEANA
jgi:hypothetical protein